MTVDERINTYFNTKWNFIDFFYAYCEARGIDDPEGGDISDEEYSEFEKIVEKKLTVGFLEKMREEIIVYITGRIRNAMGEK